MVFLQVMESGVIVEDGTHEQLLEKGGKYAQMWAFQESQGSRLDKYSSSDSEVEGILEQSDDGGGGSSDEEGSLVGK